MWSREEPKEQEEDVCIGCVTVDLSPLAFGMAQLSGWYHIVDFAGAVQGQLKVITWLVHTFLQLSGWYNYITLWTDLVQLKVTWHIFTVEWVVYITLWTELQL